ncbi:MAG: hypothetical protein R3Y15_05740 [Rikenellaceae bacterium]
MAINNLINEISNIKTLIEGWSTKPISNIEREIVLEKLRGIYDKVIFIDSIEDIPAEVENKIEDQEPAYQTISDSQAVSYEFDEQDPQSENPIYGLDDNQEAEQDAPLTFNVPEQEEEIVYQAEQEETDDDEVEDLAALSVQYRELLRKPAINTNAIESLYGEQEEPLQEQEEEQEQEEQEEITIEQPTEVVSEPQQEPIASSTVTPKSVIEEVVVPVAPKRAISIRAGIGMNDKYLMTRNMFGSDSRLFEQTINDLDQMTDINDALIYINDNFKWNPDDSGVKLLVSLLEEKLL